MNVHKNAKLTPAGRAVLVRRIEAGEPVEVVTREDLAKLDRTRPKKKTSNKDWVHPHDPEARIAKMKDGSTRTAHKFEQAVDLETGAVCAVTVQSMEGGDTASLPVTLEAAERQLGAVEAEAAEVVADKGYHSNRTMTQVRDRRLRSYVSEPDRGRRNWKRNPDAKKPTYANRRRIRGDRGKRLLRQRGEKLERGFAHMLETGGLRRVHVRGREEIRKRILIQAAAFNLGLLMRSLYGIGTPRGLQGLAATPAALVRHLGAAIGRILELVRRRLDLLSPIFDPATIEIRRGRLTRPARRSALCSTGC